MSQGTNHHGSACMAMNTALLVVTGGHTIRKEGEMNADAQFVLSLVSLAPLL